MDLEILQYAGEGQYKYAIKDLILTGLYGALGRRNIMVRGTDLDLGHMARERTLEQVVSIWSK